GATARQMLMEAAAKRLDVPLSALSTDKGYVVHQQSGKKLSYGDLANEASQFTVPADVKLKDRKDFKIIGTPVRNVDNAAMFTGKPLYGLDVYKEGMLNAMIQRAPFGMKLKDFDAEEAKAIPGIIDVVSFNNNVAIVGKSTWPLIKARRVLKVNYEPDGDVESTDDHNRLFTELLDKGKAKVMRKDGNVERTFGSAAKAVRP